MRELFGAGPPPAAPEVTVITPLAAEPAVPAPPCEMPAETGQALLEAGVQFLEALATAFTGPGAQVTTDPRTGRPALLVPLPEAQLVQRGTQALQTILQALAQKGERG
jgi:hypothetical protein